MFKGKIRTLCGNEFTAFFLKDASSDCGDSERPLNQRDSGGKHSSCASYSLKDKPSLLNKLRDLNWMDVNENSAGGGYGFSNYFNNSKNN